MKKLFLLPIIFIAFQTQAKVWRVNNNPSLDGDVLQGTTLFDNTNTASNPEAAAGDTIYFEPSATTYNGVTVNEANIVIMGYGYFLNENSGTQAMLNPATLQNLSFETGSTGSSVSGLEFADGVYFYTGNVTATRCKMVTCYFYQNAASTTYTGVRIDKCFISSQIFSNPAAAVTSVTVAIENCIFSSFNDNQGTSGINLSSKIRGLLRNNVFNQASINYYFNFYVANNIFVGATTWGGVSESGNNVFRNNLFSYPITQSQYTQVGGNAGANSGNVFAVNMGNVFNGTPDNIFVAGTTFNNRINFGTFNTETRFDLKAGSPAIAAGEGGTTVGGATVTTPNCGAYGATDPYRRGGFPNIPRITALTVPATVPNGSATMNISVSSQSNN
jgi:hypothetical protein